jgi:putative tryptophan/tyrosine transport system substrate-binding protein
VTIRRVIEVVIIALALSSSAHAYGKAPAATAPRVGFISALSASSSPSRAQAFRKGLAELGYIEGQNIVVEYRFADGKLEKIGELAALLERQKVSVIVSAGPAVTPRVRQATKTTPIVMAFDTDPVGSGFVDSLARPGGRITGLSIVSPEVSAKQVEILQQIVAGLARLAVMTDSKQPGNARALEETERAARTLGITVDAFDVRAFKNLEHLLQTLAKSSPQAMIVYPGPAATEARERVAAFAATARLPAMYWSGDFVNSGGLMTYSAEVNDLYRRAASYVVRILGGASPAEMPIEQPYKFEFVINLRAARDIGLRIPVEVLTRADRVIQ